MESIDALAKAINEYEGGLVLVSHDMRLISQVAKEIWICDKRKIERYKGDINSFKMDMRAQMGIEGDQKSVLRGDASVQVKNADATGNGSKSSSSSKPAPKPAPKLEVVAPPSAKPQQQRPPADNGVDDAATAATSGTSSTLASDATATKGRYVPPHLRKKMSSS